MAQRIHDWDPHNPLMIPPYGAFKRGNRSRAHQKGFWEAKVCEGKISGTYAETHFYLGYVEFYYLLLTKSS